MTAARQPRSVYDELLNLPDHVVGEVMAGELVVSPRPTLAHASTGAAALIDLGGLFTRGGGGGPRRWHIVAEPELHLGDDVLVPDLAGWHAERLPDIRSLKTVAVAPDWVCEILSPSTQGRDRGRKAECYAAHGVSYLWLVDPTAEFIEAFHLLDGKWLRLGMWEGDTLAEIPPFDAVALALCRWWGREPGEEREPASADDSGPSNDG